ncbi:MAG: NAD-dependent epimerase/dehydratase family protein [Luteimonas sp.]
MKKCILITGGAGFIGSALSHQLAGGDLAIVALDNLHPQIHATRSRPADLHKDVVLIEGDVCARDDWDRVLNRYAPKFVFHLAAETGTGQSLTESTRHAEVNVVGTAQMLDALTRHSAMPDKIVLTSSRAVYGEGAWRASDGSPFYPPQRDARMLERRQWDFPGAQALPFDAASTEPRPVSIYGATKLAQEHMLISWARSFSVNYCILRLQNVYGPGQAADNPYTGIVPLFSRLANAGKSIPLYEDGAMQRDFVYIEDVAKALALAMTSQTAANHTLDIGTGESITIGELAAIVSRHYDAPPPHVCALYRNGDVRHAACRPDASRTMLQWQPRVAPAEGVPALCDWIDSQLGTIDSDTVVTA